MEDLRLYINTLRHDFSKQSLTESEVSKNPILQFEKWFKEAVDAKVNEPNAMTVSTATSKGKPSARILLLRKCMMISQYLMRQVSQQELLIQTMGRLLFIMKKR